MMRAALLVMMALMSAAALEPSPPRAELAASIGGEVLHANSIEVLGLVLRDVVTTPRMDGGILRFTQAQARAYGGTASGAVLVDLRSQATRDWMGYQGYLEIHDWDVGAVAKALGANSDMGSGTITGWLEWELPGQTRDRFTARGELTIAHGTLVQFPLLANLLLGDLSPERGKDHLSMRFEIRDDQVHLLRAQLTTPVANLGIRGTISLDGELHLLVSPHLTLQWVGRIPGPGSALAGWLGDVSARVARTVVRGHIARPVIVPNPFAQLD